MEIIPLNIDVRTSGILKLTTSSLPIPNDFIVTQQFLIEIPPRQYGGNHRHLHQEIFISFSKDLELHWVENNITYIKKLREEDQLYMFIVPPNTPHAVVNASKVSPTILLELSNLREYSGEPFLVFKEVDETQKV